MNCTFKALFKSPCAIWSIIFELRIRPRCAKLHLSIYQQYYEQPCSVNSCIVFNIFIPNHFLFSQLDVTFSFFALKNIMIQFCHDLNWIGSLQIANCLFILIFNFLIPHWLKKKHLKKKKNKSHVSQRFMN